MDVPFAALYLNGGCSESAPGRAVGIPPIFVYLSIPMLVAAMVTIGVAAFAGVAGPPRATAHSPKLLAGTLGFKG